MYSYGDEATVSPNPLDNQPRFDRRKILANVVVCAGLLFALSVVAGVFMYIIWGAVILSKYQVLFLIFLVGFRKRKRVSMKIVEIFFFCKKKKNRKPRLVTFVIMRFSFLFFSIHLSLLRKKKTNIFLFSSIFGFTHCCVFVHLQLSFAVRFVRELILKLTNLVIDNLVLFCFSFVHKKKIMFSF